MAAVLTLRSTYDPGPPGHGTIGLRLRNDGDERIERFRLALTCIAQLDPALDGDLRLVRRVSGYHDFAVADALELAPGAEVVFAGLAAGHPLGHANDGPASAFVILADDTTIDVAVDPPVLSLRDPRKRGSSHRRTGDGKELPLVPWPAELEWRGGRRAPGRARLDAGGGAREAWSAVAEAEHRLFGDSVLVVEGGCTVAVEAARIVPGGYRLTVDGDAVTVAAGDTAGFRHGFTTLAQLLRGGAPNLVTIVDGPAHDWRGLHVDVARQFLPASAVERLVDLAAWRKLDRLHLHLTDDEGWRVPIEGCPDLTAVGGWRGHGLAIPPLLGSPASATGGSYTAEEIGRWVRRGRALGVVIVPEVDVPGHCHAALAAVPSLRDPDDTTAARSVQHFVDNALYPGLPETDRFLEAVFGQLATLFDSPWLHIGGDEVPDGAWARSPVVAAYARERGLAGPAAITGAFVAELVATIRRLTGRQVGAWQEAAEHGGIQPDDGYVVSWKSAADARRLAEAGFDVVVSAPDAYYLDMAPDDAWETPGASWAGSVNLADACAFDPGAGWPAEASRHLLGIQACVWTEHVRTPAVFDELVFPRLDAVAERAWRGRIYGGPDSVRRRAETLPRLATSRGSPQS